MKYYAKKLLPPFKWTPPYSFSGFRLKDNSVVLIGTNRYDGILQQSFFNYLKGSEEDVYDFLHRKMCSDREQSGKIKFADHEPISDRLWCSSKRPTSSDDFTVNKKSRVGFDIGIVGKLDRKKLLPYQCEAEDTSKKPEVMSASLKKHHLFDLVHPDRDHYLSSSSDEDLPRVQITRRKVVPVEQRQDETEGCDPPKAVKSDDTGGSSGNIIATSVSTEIPNQCPICGIDFPSG